MIKEVLLTRRMPPMQVDPVLNISPMLATSSLLKLEFWLSGLTKERCMVKPQMTP